MSRIFISHSSKDNFEALGLRDWLAANGWNDVFLDLDPERGIAAGERWERALHEAANRCEAVVFLISENWLASGWCIKEYSLARGLNKKLFAAIVDPSKTIADLPPELAGTWQVVDLTSGAVEIIRIPLPSSHEEKHVAFSVEGLRRLRKGLEKAGLDPRFFAWPPETEKDRAPYRGLKPLEGVDAGIFFGRDAPIVETTDRLRGLRAATTPRLLVILGASGAGKSSFLRAGLLPRLARDDAHFLPLPAIRPERAAVYGENGLLGALEKALPARPRAQLREAINKGAPDLRPLLQELTEAAFARTLAGEGSASPPAVIISVDQAEELFRAEGAEEGAALLALLRDLVSEDAPAVIALFAIRSDSYDDLEHAKAFEGFSQSTLPLLPMPRGAYKEVIEGPARRLNEAGGKLAIEPRLTETLLADIEKGGGKDALPLLAFTLEQLYREYGAAGTLRLADYESFGGIEGAIEKAVERVFRAADRDARIPREREARLNLLRRGLIPWLAGIDPDSKSPRRNIARRADIPEEAKPLVDLLVEERLLSTDVATGTGIATIEPAHEALLRQWGLLKGWLTEDFALLATLEGVKRGARDWDANAQSEAWLAHQSQRLAEAQALDARPDIAARLDATDRAYLAQCRAKEEAARAAEEERHRELETEQARRLAYAERLAAANKRTVQRTRIGLVVAMVLFAAAGGAGFWALQQKNVADQAAHEAQKQKQIAEENANKAQEQTRLAEQAADETAKSADEANRQTALATKAAKEARVQRDQALTKESLLLADKAREQLKLGKATNAALLAIRGLPQKDERPWVAETFGALIEALGAPREALILRGHESEVDSAVFSHDGHRILTAARDNTARVWDAATGKEIAVLRGHEKHIYSAVFSPDDAHALTACDDGTARIWDVKTGHEILSLHGGAPAPEIKDLEKFGDAPVTGAMYSPNGLYVLTLSGPEPRIWDAATGKELTILRAHYPFSAHYANFSPDSKRVATVEGSSQNRVVLAGVGANVAHISAVPLGNVIATFSGHVDRVNSAVFSPDGIRVVTASDDKTAQVWDAATGKVIAILKGHEQRVSYATFSPDGKRVVTVSDDKTARLWDAATGKQTYALRGHEGEVTAATFSPDGLYVVTAGKDIAIHLWETATGNEIAVFKGHDTLVNAVTFSPDGKQILSASGDKTARLWNVGSAKRSILLQGHDDALSSVVFSPDGARVLTGSWDGTARLWNSNTGAQIAILKGHSDTLTSVVFSSDGNKVLTASMDGTARLWDATTGKVISVLYILTTDPYDIHGNTKAVFSPDGARILTASSDGIARLWDTATGKEIGLRMGQSNPNGGHFLFSAAFSPDGKHVVTASQDKTARIWDAALGEEILVLRGHDGLVLSAVFSPDGARVLTASKDKTARIWDAATGKMITVLSGHEDTVDSAVFDSDETRIVTASSDKTVRVWDSATGKQIAVIRGFDGVVSSAVFSPNGTRILAGASDGVDHEHKFDTTVDLKGVMHATRVFSAYPNNFGRILWLGRSVDDVMANARNSLPGYFSPNKEQPLNLLQVGDGSVTEEQRDASPPNKATATVTTGISSPATAAPLGQIQPLPATDCDRLAASAVDGNRPAGVAGVAPDKIDVNPAIQACQAALAVSPDEPRLKFQLARAFQAGLQFDKALPLYHEAAEAGYGLAMNNLGSMYQNGQGVAKDEAKAAQFYRDAAAASIAIAARNLGAMYENGTGVAKDRAEAIRLYRKAADAGEPGALYSLGRIYESGSGVPKDHAEALRLYQKASDAGSPQAMYLLGMRYLTGQDVAKDTDKGVHLVLDAADAGNAFAMTSVGKMYEEGQFLPQQYAKAFDYYQRASTAGQTPAMYRLAMMFLEGRGTLAHRSEALYWLQTAASRGDENAKMELKKMN